MRHAMRKPIYKHGSTGRGKEIKVYNECFGGGGGVVVVVCCCCFVVDHRAD